MRLSRTIPNLVKFITRSLVTTAVVRPLVTVGLFWGGAHAVELAAGHVVNMVGDIVVGAATAVTGEGLIAKFTYPLQQLLSKLFARFYVERADILAASLARAGAGARGGRGEVAGRSAKERSLRGGRPGDSGVTRARVAASSCRETRNKNRWIH